MNQAQKGAVLVELAITIPLVVALIVGTIDLCRAINDYFFVVRSAYEGARYASTIKEIPEGCFGPACAAGEPQQSALVLVRNRVLNLLVKKKIDEGSEITVAVTNVGHREINVRVRTPFQALFPLFKLLSISAEVTSSDLYPDT